MALIHDGMTLLFQGDSVTDCGRSREDTTDLGPGYPRFAAEELAKRYPNLRVINRGISGNRSGDLVARWEEDCLALKPDLLSILIGINDTWRRFDSNSPTTAAEYEANMRRLLADVRDRLGIPVVLMEPFVLEVQPGQADWREDLDAKIDVLRRLAREFGCLLVPLDGLFAAESCRMPMERLATDGVHPTEEGARLIARAFVEAVQ